MTKVTSAALLAVVSGKISGRRRAEDEAVVEDAVEAEGGGEEVTTWIVEVVIGEGRTEIVGPLRHSKMSLGE